MVRHEQVCLERAEAISNKVKEEFKEEVRKELQAEFSERIQKLEKMIHERPASQTTNNNNTNSHNTIIQLISFGNEDFSSLSKSEILKVLGSRYSSLQQFVQQTHLNDRLPEQKNVYISNLRSNECKVVEDGRWITRSTDEVVDEIVANGVANIEAYLDEHDIKLTQERMDKLRDLLVKIQDEDEAQFIKNVKTSIKRLLYDNKDRVKA